MNHRAIGEATPTKKIMLHGERFENAEEVDTNGATGSTDEAWSHRPVGTGGGVQARRP